MCDKRAVIWHVKEIFLFTFFSIAFSFLARSLQHHYTTLPSDLLLPSSFYSHFKKRCLTTIAEAAVVSKEHQPPSTFHIYIKVWAKRIVWVEAQNYLVMIRRISGGLKNFLYHVRAGFNFSKSIVHQVCGEEYVLVNNLLRWWWDEGDCKIEEKRKKKWQSVGDILKTRRHLRQSFLMGICCSCFQE